MCCQLRVRKGTQRKLAARWCSAPCFSCATAQSNRPETKPHRPETKLESSEIATAHARGRPEPVRLCGCRRVGFMTALSACCLTGLVLLCRRTRSPRTCSTLWWSPTWRRQRASRRRPRWRTWSRMSTPSASAFCRRSLTHQVTFAHKSNWLEGVLERSRHIKYAISLGILPAMLDHATGDARTNCLASMASIALILHEQHRKRAVNCCAGSDAPWAERGASAQAAAALAATSQALSGRAAEVLVGRLAGAAIGGDDAAPVQPLQLNTQQARLPRTVTIISYTFGNHLSLQRAALVEVGAARRHGTRPSI